MIVLIFLLSPNLSFNVFTVIESQRRAERLTCRQTIVLRRVRLGTYKVFCLNEHGLCQEFLRFCRAVVLSPEARKEVMDKQLNLARPLSFDAEIRALRHAENLIISSLNRLPSRQVIQPPHCWAKFLQY